MLRNALENPWKKDGYDNHYWLAQLLKAFDCTAMSEGACFGYAGMALHETFAENLDGFSDRVALLLHIPGVLLWEKAKNLALKKLDYEEAQVNKLTPSELEELHKNIDLFEKKLIKAYIQNELYNLITMEEKVTFPYYEDLFNEALIQLGNELVERLKKAGQWGTEEFDASLLTLEENKIHFENCQKRLKQLLYFDIAYFLQGIYIYQQKHYDRKTVEESAVLVNEVATQLKPPANQSGEININFERVSSFTGAYTLEDLVFLFELLTRYFKQNQISKVVFLLNYGLHAAAIIYDQNSWIFKEVNTAKNHSANLNHIKNANVKIATQALHSAVEIRDTTVIGFTLYSLSKDNALLVKLMAYIKNLLLWKSIHHPSQVKAQFRNQYQISWLHLAAEFGEIDQLKALISLKIPVDCKDLYGSTPLNKALANRQFEAAKILLDNGADPNHPISLLCLVIEHFPEATQLLIEHKACINILDEDNNSPLFYAIERGDESLVTLLLDNGADPDLPLVNNGERASLIDFANQKGLYKIAELLITARESKRNKQSIAALIQLNLNEQKGKKRREVDEGQDKPLSDNRNSYFA